ncbi:MAG: aconitate hydratase AcnA [Thermoanaerobaculia bacterium]|nr:aconitate hydratase AcnA [Thermoanaerobaculia bacterium]
MSDSFDTFRNLSVGGRTYRLAHLPSLSAHGMDVDRLPFSMRILLENLLRREDGETVPASDIEAVARWDPAAEPSTEIAFMPARVLLQDFTGVPAIVDLAAMRDAMVAMGGEAEKINPLQPAELVIDHSVQVDEYGTQAAFLINKEKEFERNRERYGFLKWGQRAFRNFKVVPPGTGIVHQVNLEYLGRVVMAGDETSSGDGAPWAYPDSLVGTDSHTTMINGLGVLGWGVGGIEAEAAMLGQPISMLVPQVVGFKLTGELSEGATATDLVLTVTQMLREYGVVGKFVEFYGPGLARLPVADRATIANMSPEYGATCGIFPIDRATLEYMKLTGRPAERIELVERYAREQGLFHTSDSPDAEYSGTLELDLGSVEPSLAGPKRPQDRIELSKVKQSFLDQVEQLKAPGGSRPKTTGGLKTLGKWEAEGGTAVLDVVEANPNGGRKISWRDREFSLRDGSVVIAAITSCTNTSNPSVMLGAGLLARNAVRRGLEVKPWVKTSLAPGSKVVTEYLEESGLLDDLEALNFHLVGYGCTTCIGNSGPLPPPISEAIREEGLVAASVLSGNRNFEGRISPDVRANYLASPPLVVAYALAGRIDVDLYSEPLGEDPDGNPVYLKEIWPSQEEIAEVVQRTVRSEMFTREYGEVYAGDEQWNAMPVPEGETYAWEEDSTYVRLPPFFVDLPREPEPVEDLAGLRVLALVGDSVTTDHISPAGAFAADSPAGRYLQERGVPPKEFNSYGSRRGNHEVMMRGTFANVRFRNKLAPGREGGYTTHQPSGEEMTIYDASMRYQKEGVSTLVIAGLEYGTGSSRDWAAKGPSLLGVRVVIAASYERIHRSNLIGMGVLPLEFLEGDDAASLGLTGREEYAVEGLADLMAGRFEKGVRVTVRARAEDGGETSFEALVRLDTPQEARYLKHGGILQYVLRQLL